MVATAVQNFSLDQLEALYQQVKTYVSDKYSKAQTTAGDVLSTATIKQTAQQLVTAGMLSSAVMFNKPVDTQVAEKIAAIEEKKSDPVLAEVTLEERQAIMDKLKEFAKRPVGHLPQEDELYLEQQLSDILGFEVTAELEGNRLNHSIGIMGGEQHLRRFPTDTLAQHDAYQESGIAPNRGAFGWFTENGQLTAEAILREKYYFAVQTLYLPNWNSDHVRLKPWYKFRKMVAINPADQVAVVGVVGDAGPAQWVKKQYGGSPEVIREGKIWSKEARGRVILLFVDDPENKVPLGPIDLKLNPQLAEQIQKVQ